MHPLRRLFYPERVLIYGVSDSPSNLAKYTAMNLQTFHFPGTFDLVGKDGGTWLGRPIHRDIAQIDGTPDLAVLLIPARSVPQVLEDCGKKGVSFAVVQAAGFSEYDEEKSGLEDEIRDVIHRYGIRLMGPNCIGTVNLDNGLLLPFFPVEPEAVQKGPASIVAQSGGIVMDSMRLLALENIGMNKVLSIGNKLDLNECDYLSFFMDDPETRMVGLYLENVSDGRRLMEIARTARKPVVVLKANRTPASREIARFHTTALAGDDDVADAAFRQAGMHRVDTLGEMMEVFKAFLLPPMAGGRVGVLCRSGGQGVILADAVHRAGFRLAKYSDAVYDTIRRETRAGVIRMTNPLDLGDIFDFRFYFTVLEKALQEPGVDGVVFGQTYLHSAQIPETQDLIRAALELSERYRKPIIIYLIASRKFHFPLKETCAMPLFSDADQALSALAVSHRFHLRQQVLDRQPAGTVFHSLPAAGPGGQPVMLPPGEAFGMLASYGVPHAPCAVAGSRSEALEAAGRLGYPVALKTADPEVLHKTETGAVRLNLPDGEALAEALDRMGEGPWLVQKMMPPGREVIVGGRQDREFGPLVIFGLGGILTEVLRDAALRVAPLTEEEAGALIGEIRGAALLKGFRGEEPSDEEALRRLVSAVSRLLAEHPEIRNLDMNPVLVYGRGGGCSAVDVKIQAFRERPAGDVRSP